MRQVFFLSGVYSGGRSFKSPVYVPCAGRSGRIGSHEKNIMSARKLSLEEEEEEERCGTECLLGTSCSGSCFCFCCEALDFSRKLHHPRFLIYLLLYNRLDVYYIHREAYNLQGIKLTPFRPAARDGPSPVTPSISPRPQQTFNLFFSSFFRSFSPSSFSHIDTHLKR